MKYVLIVYAALFLFCSCSSYTEEGALARPSNYQNLRKTIITFNDSVFKYDSLYLIYMDSLSQENNSVVYQFSKNERDKIDMFVEIFECNDMYCSDAYMIVFHDAEYKKSKILEKGRFSINQPKQKLRTGEEFGTDCTLKVYNFFDLKIDLDDLKIDWTIQEAKEICDVVFYY